MKKLNIFACLLTVVSAMTLTSCLKDQEDLFDESASKRLITYQNEIQKVLMSAENGWELRYFPDREQQYGGYTYTVKFNEDSVFAHSEIAEKIAGDITEVYASTYILNNEDGPCLLFDTYNPLLHFYTTPSGSSGPGGYEAYDGDHMFIVLDISEDKNTITLKGSRSGNIMYMHRLTKDPVEYLNDVIAVENEMVFPNFYNADTTVILTIDGANRQFVIEDTNTGETGSAAFIFTPTGGEFYSPIQYQGKDIFTFTYNAETSSIRLEGIDTNFKMDVPPIDQLVFGGIMDWYLSKDNLCPTWQNLWTTAATNLKNQEGEALTTYLIEGDVIYIVSGQYKCFYTAKFETESINEDGTECVVSVSGLASHAADNGNAAWYINNVSGFINFLAPFQTQTYKVTYGNAKRSIVNLVNTADPSLYFSVTKNSVAPY